MVKVLQILLEKNLKIDVWMNVIGATWTKK